jgi:hypothetical protein
VDRNRAKTSQNLSMWLMKTDPRGQGDLKRLRLRTGVPSGRNSMFLACVSQTDKRNRYFRSLKILFGGLCVSRLRQNFGKPVDLVVEG